MTLVQGSDDEGIVLVPPHYPPRKPRSKLPLSLSLSLPPVPQRFYAMEKNDKPYADAKSDLPPPTTARDTSGNYSIHPFFYVAIWIGFSSSVILFNKYILSTLSFPFPVTLTALHLLFATLATRLLAHTTSLLDSRHESVMDWKQWSRRVLPIGVAFTASLIFSNQAYLWLSVSFIQMLKATTPVVVLLTSWAFGMTHPSLRILLNVLVIVLGVIIASYGEIHFVTLGVCFQALGIVFEAVRLVMVQRLLGASGHKMDPMVSLYHFAPVCASFLTVIALYLEAPYITLEDVNRVGVSLLFFTAAVAFMLNLSVVFLIGRTSSLVLTLSGVVKDILLVSASFVMFGDPITPTQLFGYSIALGGLMWYKMGMSQVQELMDRMKLTVKLSVGKFGGGRVVLVVVGVMVGIVVILGYFGEEVEWLKRATMDAREPDRL
ncbi:hypothetical protein YB2330_005830 [Saitoella coloradoensis]